MKETTHDRGIDILSNLLSLRTLRHHMFNDTAKQLIDIKARYCGTCRWWNGEREIKFMSQRPVKVQTTGTGRCAAKGISCSGRNGCSKWTKSEKMP